MKRIVAIAVVLFFVFCPFNVKAAEVNELPGEELAEELVENTPERARKLADKLGIDEITPEKLMAVKPMDLLNLAFESFKDYITKPIRNIAAILAIIVFCAVAEVFKPSASESLNGAFSAVSSLAISGILVSTAMECIGNVCEATRDFSDFMMGYVPVFTSAVTVSGQPIAGGVYSGFMLLVCQIISGVSANVLLPLLGIYLALSLVGGVNPSLKVKAVADAFKTVATKTLGLALTVFVGMMSLQTLVATGSDNLAVKTGKYLIGNFVPVVGSAISDVFLSVQGYMKLMKTCIGWYGIAVALLIFLPIVVETVVWRVSIYAAQTVSQILDIPSANVILDAVGSVFTMLLAIVLTFALLLIVTTTIMLAVGTG